MKKNLFILVLFFCQLSFAQETMIRPNPDRIEDNITEVYGDIEKGSQLYKNLNLLLSERVYFKRESVSKEEKYPNTKDISLLNKRNKSLKRDIQFNPENFNVLKYNLKFYDKLTKVYRLENTEWLIIVTP